MIWSHQLRLSSLFNSDYFSHCLSQILRVKNELVDATVRENASVATLRICNSVGASTPAVLALKNIPGIYTCIIPYNIFHVVKKNK